MAEDTFARFVERYATNQLPWDDPLPPPEVIDLVPQLDVGRMVDLGCGYGRTAIYLAQHGWLADGVDYVPAAVAGAKERAAAAGVADRTNFYQGSASAPHMLSGPYDLVVDIGCMHSFPEPQLIEYRDSLTRLLRSGAIYLLFAHLRHGEPQADERPHGILDSQIKALFADHFKLDKVEYGSTKVEDKDPWDSAWYWFRKM